MTFAAPPWCLSWTANGELEVSDRRDLFLQLMRREAGVTRHVLDRFSITTWLEMDPMGSTPRLQA